MKSIIVVCLLGVLLVGCATRMSTSDPFLTVVWGDAYTLDCESGLTVSPEGEAVCADGDSVEVRGGNLGESFVAMVKGLFEVIGGLLPRGV
jgi:hypothetical protein